MKVEKTVSVELNGTKSDGTYCSINMQASCGDDDAKLYISEYSDGKSQAINIKFSRSELEQFVEALQKVL